MIGVASVKPEDAASNIASWVELFGFHNLPHWLTSPHADQHVISGTVAAAAIYAFAVWGPHRQKRGMDVNTWGHVDGTCEVPLGFIAKVQKL